VIVCPFYFPGV
jgi:hypothetical protein